MHYTQLLYFIVVLVFCRTIHALSLSLSFSLSPLSFPPSHAHTHSHGNDHLPCFPPFFLSRLPHFQGRTSRYKKLRFRFCCSASMSSMLVGPDLFIPYKPFNSPEGASKFESLCERCWGVSAPDGFAYAINF